MDANIQKKSEVALTFLLCCAGSDGAVDTADAHVTGSRGDAGDVDRTGGGVYWCGVIDWSIVGVIAIAVGAFIVKLHVSW